jgi:hypothetical protein
VCEAAKAPMERGKSSQAEPGALPDRRREVIARHAGYAAEPSIVLVGHERSSRQWFPGRLAESAERGKGA